MSPRQTGGPGQWGWQERPSGLLQPAGGAVPCLLRLLLHLGTDSPAEVLAAPRSLLRKRLGVAPDISIQVLAKIADCPGTRLFGFF